MPLGPDHSYSAGTSYNTPQHATVWPSNDVETNSENQNKTELIDDDKTELNDNHAINSTYLMAKPTGTNSTILTPIALPDGATIPSLSTVTTSGATIPYDISSYIIPVVLIGCGLFMLAAVIAGFVYRKHLCAIGKTLKKKSKEEMVKKSNQSNISSTNLTDDSRNSMVLQHWNGPTAYGNRYVPWERDQPHQQQHQMLQSSIVSISMYIGPFYYFRRSLEEIYKDKTSPCITF